MSATPSALRPAARWPLPPMTFPAIHSSLVFRRPRVERLRQPCETTLPAVIYVSLRCRRHSTIRAAALTIILSDIFFDFFSSNVLLLVFTGTALLFLFSHILLDTLRCLLMSGKRAEAGIFCKHSFGSPHGLDAKSKQRRWSIRASKKMSRDEHEKQHISEKRQGFRLRSQ